MYEEDIEMPLSPPSVTKKGSKVSEEKAPLLSSIEVQPAPIKGEKLKFKVNLTCVIYFYI